MKLYIGNKNYSSWSMRPWVLLTQAGIPFDEVMVRFDAFTPDSQFKATLRPLSPKDKAARARARSLCAEMHSGFTALRSACPMNIEASLPDVGALIWRDNAGVRADVARLVAMWQQCLRLSGGPMLFGEFSVADAYFAPVCMRLVTYALPLPEDIAAYVQRLCALPGVKAWIDAARAEHDFLDFEEPYRLHA
jgi:glutathione S-transferase